MNRCSLSALKWLKVDGMLSFLYIDSSSGESSSIELKLFFSLLKWNAHTEDDEMTLHMCDDRAEFAINNKVLSSALHSAALVELT